jgi:hypothetical protein
VASRIAWIMATGLLTGVLATPAWSDERTLARARQLYNAGNQDAAIEAAKEARADVKTADPATLPHARES